MLRLNFAYITLIPKIEGIFEPNKLRPISLLTPYKIITKVLSNRLQPIIEQLVDPSQTAFLKQRSILDSIATAQELITVCTKQKWAGIFLKLDFQSAFDLID